MISRKEDRKVKTRKNKLNVALNQTATFNIRNAIHTGSKERHFIVVLIPLSSYCIGSLHSHIKWYVTAYKHPTPTTAFFQQRDKLVTQTKNNRRTTQIFFRNCLFTLTANSSLISCHGWISVCQAHKNIFGFSVFGLNLESYSGGGFPTKINNFFKNNAHTE